MTIDNMGAAKMCLADISLPQVKYEDLEFTDPITREKTNY
jgi:hypothetical protein